jgi:hypothetical protein
MEIPKERPRQQPPTFRIFPEMVPLPPPGFPRIKAKWQSSSGAAAVIDDMKLRCADVEQRLRLVRANAIIFEALFGTSTFLCQERCERRIFFQSAGQLTCRKQKRVLVSGCNCASITKKLSMQTGKEHLPASILSCWKQMRPMRMLQLSTSWSPRWSWGHDAPERMRSQII